MLGVFLAILPRFEHSEALSARTVKLTRCKDEGEHKIPDLSDNAYAREISEGEALL